MGKERREGGEIREWRGGMGLKEGECEKREKVIDEILEGKKATKGKRLRNGRSEGDKEEGERRHKVGDCEERERRREWGSRIEGRRGMKRRWLWGNRKGGERDERM